MITVLLTTAGHEYLLVFRFVADSAMFVVL